MKHFFLSIIFSIPYLLPAQETILPIIPKPNKIISGNGTFTLTKNTRIVSPGSASHEDINWLNDYLEKYNGFKLEVVRGTRDSSNCIFFSALKEQPPAIDSYKISIRSNCIVISAGSNDAGLFYAFQSLVQLIPPTEIKSLKQAPKSQFTIPCVTIEDSPRFQWRGMHLDVCRHFFPVSFVKRYIDLIAQYKMNVFHWHLTEDQGWRIEIKKYPKLTTIGSWRSGTMVGKYSNQKYDTVNYGGFYTQEEIKDVVAYAQTRHITIVPEIEMPGHSLAAIAAYRWLSCTGKPQQVAKGWGVFDDVYCPKDSTFNFLQDVLDEVIALFPGQYIHIGGDECPKTRWKTCSHCQAIIKQEGLKDEHELQSYFIRRIEKYLNSKGKQIIGWDEILEGGLAPNAAVMSWRGTQGGIEAAKQKHYVVMTPGKPCYFDHYQSKNKQAEPLAIGGFNPLDSVYNYEPVPSVLSNEDKKFIMGAQANVWTEYILTEKQVEYMAVPRMLALAEVNWTQPENKNFKQFLVRLKKHKAHLDAQQVNYAKHFLPDEKKK